MIGLKIFFFPEWDFRFDPTFPHIPVHVFYYVYIWDLGMYIAKLKKKNMNPFFVLKTSVTNIHVILNN